MENKKKKEPRFQYLDEDKMEKFCESSDWDSDRTLSYDGDEDESGSRVSNAQLSPRVVFGD